MDQHEVTREFGDVVAKAMVSCEVGSNGEITYTSRDMEAFEIAAVLAAIENLDSHHEEVFAFGRKCLGVSRSALHAWSGLDVQTYSEAKDKGEWPDSCWHKLVRELKEYVVREGLNLPAVSVSYALLD